MFCSGIKLLQTNAIIFKLTYYNLSQAQLLKNLRKGM